VNGCRHCADFSRTQLIRAAAAEAGRGLPMIEPGMPIPAGTGLTRRSFLARSVGLALSVYGVDRLSLGALDDGIAHAATGGRVLVSVFLAGGADSLSLLYPANEAQYLKLRPKLALPASAGPAFAEDTRLHWHPSLAPIAQLHGEGKVVVLPAIGYDHPDQSHFTSRHYWEVGATNADLRTGWLGRYLDAVGTVDNPLQGLSLDGELSPALASAKVPVAAVDGSSYGFWTSHVWGTVEQRLYESLKRIGSAAAAKQGWTAAAGNVSLQSMRLREQLLPFSGDGDKPAFTSPVAYPDGGDEGFPKQLAGLAAMLAAGLPLKCVAVTATGGYDTHADQPDALAKGIDLTAKSLLAFQRDLEARGLADRVVVHVWTEFGRRAEENGDNGTDHGAAGTGFLIGSRVNGKLVGEFPGLTSGLDEDGNLRATADFRGVYGALLEQWFETDAGAVIPNAAAFARPSLIR
jgi:uncharacterized protein (DUF1501 family)